MVPDRSISFSRASVFISLPVGKPTTLVHLYVYLNERAKVMRPWCHIWPLRSVWTGVEAVLVKCQWNKIVDCLSRCVLLLNKALFAKSILMVKTDYLANHICSRKDQYL